MATMVETSASPTNTRSRKRSRVETSPDADGDKRRGRPRVDKNDESAADRRRTQIRMAQRAYRQRKESTLEELRKRVSDLTNTMELMNRHVTDFGSRLRGTGLTEGQMSELDDFSLRIEALLKSARDATDETSPPALVSATTSTPDPLTSQDQEVVESTIASRARNVPSWLDQSVISSEAQKGFTPADFGLGYIFAAGGDEAPLDLGPLSKDLGPVLTNNPSASPEKITFSNAFFDDDFAPFPVPSPQPSPPRTFSFQESTFARRLHRACLERAHQLLLEPDIRPATYERVFRLSLLGRSRAKILNVIKIVLARGPHQDLDFWEAPVIHVGGAGTHYPPRDAFGNILPQRKSRNVGRIGPQTLALLDNASREQISHDMTVDIVGYEGEWFDPSDVQGYLEEKGIFIDAAATFAEADMIVEPLQIASGASTASPAQARTPSLQNELQEISILNDTEASQWDDLFAGAGLTSVGFSDAQTGSFMNFLQPGESIKRTLTASTPQALGWADDWMNAMGDAQDVSFSTPSARQQVRTRKVVIDVRKLVKALSTSGVCLGRSPGFRRKDVDHALKLATLEPSSI